MRGRMRQQTTAPPSPRAPAVSEVEIHLETDEGTLCDQPKTANVRFTHLVEELTCLACWARRIRELRENVGLSRRELQEQLDLRPNAVWRVELDDHRNRG